MPETGVHAMAMPRCRSVLVAALLVTCIACSPAADSGASRAQRALDEQRYADAISIAEAGLAEVGGDPARGRVIWRLEKIRMEALARSGDVDGLLASLERLSDEFPTQVNANLLLAFAQNVFETGDAVAAERLLEWGGEEFPEDEALLSDLAIFWKNGGDISPEACERLRSLGYLDC
jgi:hypothetical protein